MRLVDADILLTAFPKGENEIFRTSAVRGTIDACPTADAIPVVHGRWIKVNGKTVINCSACYHCSWSLSFEDTVKRFKFCPNCGARMDGGENEAD